jgi:hypothetical protein
LSKIKPNYYFELFLEKRSNYHFVQTFFCHIYFYAFTFKFRFFSCFFTYLNINVCFREERKRKEIKNESDNLVACQKDFLAQTEFYFASIRSFWKIKLHATNIQKGTSFWIFYILIYFSNPEACHPFAWTIRPGLWSSNWSESHIRHK